MYAHGGSLLDCQSLLDDLILSLQSGQKFIYSKAASNANHAQIKESIDLLRLAGLIYPVTHTSANGLPLEAEVNTKFRKYILLDTGILHRFLNLDMSKWLINETLEQINKGDLAEMFVGLEILKSAPANHPLHLHYWQREVKDSNAEVDYLVQRNMDIIPVEVKSGTSGAMQSTRKFLSEKKSPYGIRCSLENFGQLPDIKIYPLYAASLLASS